MNDNKIIISPRNYNNCSYSCKNLKIYYIPRCIKFNKSIIFTGDHFRDFQFKRCADCLKATGVIDNEK